MAATEMAWYQREIQLTSRDYGVHVVTQEIVDHLPELTDVMTGLLHLHLLHTSAALGLNEAVEPEVRADIEHFLDELAPEDNRRYTHNYEGPDDMPAHIKSLLIGPSLTLPIRRGQLWLGTWQGIYLCEFRRRAAARRLVATIHGQSSVDAEKE